MSSLIINPKLIPTVTETARRVSPYLTWLSVRGESSLQGLYDHLIQVIPSSSGIRYRSMGRLRFIETCFEFLSGGKGYRVQLDFRERSSGDQVEMGILGKTAPLWTMPLYTESVLRLSLGEMDDS